MMHTNLWQLLNLRSGGRKKHRPRQNVVKDRPGGTHTKSHKPGKKGTKHEVKRPINKFKVDPCGGEGFRKLREDELQTLKHKLIEFSETATKISAQEIDFKKDLVTYIIHELKTAFEGRLFKTFNTGSAYEKVQAGEAKDFDVMLFLNVKRWSWKVEDDPDRPSYCWITRGEHREKDKENSFTHLLDDKGRLSSLKVRKLFTSKVDKFLRKNNPLEFKHKRLTPTDTEAEDAAGADGGETAQEEETYKVYMTRKYQGPATTLNVKCNGMEFTLDLVNSLHGSQVRSGEMCDFVAKPYEKQKIFGTEFEHLWRKAYSRSESGLLKSIDEGDGIHRKLLRIFKILRIHQSQLNLLKSYIFKNLLLYMSNLTDREWKEEDIASRFVDMVIALRNCLAKRELPAFYDEKVNLLRQREHEYEEEHTRHIMGYLRRIANKGIEGYEGLLTLKQLPSTTTLRPAKEDLEDSPPAKKRLTEQVEPAQQVEPAEDGCETEMKVSEEKEEKKVRKRKPGKKQQHSRNREAKRKLQKEKSKSKAVSTSDTVANKEQMSKRGKKKARDTTETTSSGTSSKPKTNSSKPKERTASNKHSTAAAAAATAAAFTTKERSTVKRPDASAKTTSNIKAENPSVLAASKAREQLGKQSSLSEVTNEHVSNNYLNLFQDDYLSDYADDYSMADPTDYSFDPDDFSLDPDDYSFDPFDY